MPDVYSRLLFAGSLPTNLLTSLFVVPTGATYVVRDMSVLLPSSSELFNIQVGPPGSTTVVWYWTARSTPDWQHWEGRLTVPTGMNLWGYASGADAQLTVSGYHLGAG